jgi:Flp pilus assembly protein TadD
MGIGPGGGPRDARQARLEAEHAFNQGLRLQRESLLPGALREFRRAVELLPDEPEYRLLEAWLEYRIAQGGDARGLAAAKVRACADRVLRASESSARAHAVLGQLALQEGDDPAAERSLRLAVRYDAADVETARALRLLEMRRRTRS